MAVVPPKRPSCIASLRRSRTLSRLNKLLQDVLAQKVGVERARRVFAEIAGTYEMRLGDVYPTGSKVADGMELADINQSVSFLRQGEQLIHNFGRSVWFTGALLFRTPAESVAPL